MDSTEADAWIIEGAIWVVPLALMIWLTIASWRERKTPPEASDR